MPLNIGTNKTIARNTLLLYFRMLLTMGVALYTSRVILQILGVDDFGIYEAVGGIVSFLSFLNSALASGSSRFLSYELGKGGDIRMERNFSTILHIHIVLAIIIALVAETVGMYFLNNELNIPLDRMGAATVVFHLSILTAVLSITQVPYTASIISHEKMDVFAYFSVIDVVLKLVIVFALVWSNDDRLILYAILMFLVQIGMTLTYRIYCIKHYKETHFHLICDKDILKQILGYSVWNILTNITLALKNQGVILLISMFFSPTIVVSRAVANRVNMAALQFANNFRIAANPQIIKRYAAGDMDGSKRLVKVSSIYSYYLMLLLSLPIILLAEPLLQLWLGQVPEYSVIFLQIALVSSLVTSMNDSFYTALCAVGKLKFNSVACALVSICAIPAAYAMFKLGFSPVAVAVTVLVTDIIISIIIKPWAMVRGAGYRWGELMLIFVKIGVVTIFSLPFSILAYLWLPKRLDNSLFANAMIVLVCVFNTITAVWFIGIDKITRKKLISFVKSKISR